MPKLARALREQNDSFQNIMDKVKTDVVDELMKLGREMQVGRSTGSLLTGGGLFLQKQLPMPCPSPPPPPPPNETARRENQTQILVALTWGNQRKQESSYKSTPGRHSETLDFRFALLL